MCVFGRGIYCSPPRGQPVHIWNASEIFTGATDTGTHHCQHCGFKIEGSLSENDCVISLSILSIC